ncbi:hypothetical protein SASPL_103709 [Salvia splendens]|uniref:Acireductone dioxygenase n=1 Tax=Salvia splendens TaxID=180675 RepID=A0A8X8YFR1_SALSN|nr:hypothetical protein SASPL_103709 [Salvia splendens]
MGFDVFSPPPFIQAKQAFPKKLNSLAERVWGEQASERRMGSESKDPREEVIQAWYMDDSDADQRLPHHRDPQEFVSFEKLDGLIATMYGKNIVSQSSSKTMPSNLPYLAYRVASKIVALSFSELGVLSWRLDADNYETDPKLKKIREDRGYSYMDFCEVCPEKLPNYEEKIKNFYEEHLHTDEEIRYCVAGSGYFDVRDRDEAWIRIWVKKGAMIVLPAGIYHRFLLIQTITSSTDWHPSLNVKSAYAGNEAIVGDPVWTPFNRPHDHLPASVRLFPITAHHKGLKEYVDNFVNKAGGGQPLMLQQLKPLSPNCLNL